MEERISGRPQKVSLLNRSVGTITGVQEVQGFNETEISLDTDLGLLVIRGTGLHVTSLNLEKGEVEIDGMIDALNYVNKKVPAAAGGLFGRLFR